MTLFLALWGAVVSTALAVFQIVAHLRDRPRLVLTTRVGTRSGEPPYFGIDVANTGQQPTSLIEVGFEVADGSTYSVRKEGQPEVEVAPPRFQVIEVGRIALVPPGEMKRFYVEPGELLPTVSADAP